MSFVENYQKYLDFQKEIGFGFGYGDSLSHDICSDYIEECWAFNPESTSEHLIIVNDNKFCGYSKYIVQRHMFESTAKFDVFEKGGYTMFLVWDSILLDFKVIILKTENERKN